MKKQIPGIFRELRAYKPREIDHLDLDALPFTGRIVNDRKVSDHHAIIPTGALPTNLPQAEQRVFDAVVTRFIAAFYPPCLKEVTTVDGATNKVPFRARGVRVIQPGWTEIEQSARENQGEDEKSLPAFTPGETGAHDPFIKQGETSPPKHFTENTLLGAMETAGKLVEDEELREALKEKGLGTPATRAAIIETLLKRGYIKREKKNLLATDLGRYLIALVRDRDLKSPELTGQWEAKLRKIEAGELLPEQFMQAIADFTRKIVRSDEGAVIDEQRLGKCPRCGSEVIQGNRGYGCSAWKDGCKFVLWPTYKDRELSSSEIRELLQHGALIRPIELPGAGQVILSMTESGAVTDIPVPKREPRSGNTKRKRARATGKRKRPGRQEGEKAVSEPSAALGICPLCGAEVREQKKSYSCSGWKQGCKFVIWKTMAGKKIGARTAKSLLTKGATSRLKGFKSKAGKSFDARLKLVGGKVEFDFSP
jgi:DNA topoisomerase-3